MPDKKHPANFFAPGKSAVSCCVSFSHDTNVEALVEHKISNSKIEQHHHNGEQDKRKLTHQLLDKPKLKFSFLAKSQVKKNQLANFSELYCQ